MCFILREVLLAGAVLFCPGEGDPWNQYGSMAASVCTQLVAEHHVRVQCLKRFLILSLPESSVSAKDAYHRAASDTNSDVAVRTRPGARGLLSVEPLESVESHCLGNRLGDVGLLSPLFPLTRDVLFTAVKLVHT